MSAHLSPGPRTTRPRPGRVFLAALIAAAVGAAATAVVALIVVPADARTPVSWFGAAATLALAVAVAVAAHGVETVRDLRALGAAADTDAVRLADETLPDLVDRLGEGKSVDTALAELPPVATDAQWRVLHTLATEIGRVERTRAAAMAACANAAGRVQALATSMLADLREMEERHDEHVLGDLMKLDHSTAQAGRLADSIAVLTGARSGRRWTKPIVLESILRGAVGRISAYQRVQVHSTCTSAVVGYAAEGVMHALAELVDNATKFSPPSEQVHVYVEEVQAGVVVTVEDAGLVMGDLALRRAEQAVSSGALDLTGLSGTRLGLAVVGSLAGKYGLTVSFRPSSRGGTGVVVMIPRVLITEPRQDPASAPGRPLTPPVPRHAAADPAPDGDGLDELVEPAGLPQRRRGQTLAAVVAASPAPPRAEPSAGSRPKQDAGAAFGAFHRAIRGNLTDADLGDNDSG